MPKRQTLSIRPVNERDPREAVAGSSECLGTQKVTIRTKCKQGVIKAGANWLTGFLMEPERLCLHHFIYSVLCFHIRTLR